VGPRWGCISLDRATRFVVAWGFGSCEEDVAPNVVELTRRRTHNRAGVPWVSDGKAVYRKYVRKVYRDPHRTGKRGRPPLLATPGAGLTQAVKRRVGGRVVGIEVRHMFGEGVGCPYVVYQERLNGVLRDRLNCLTRKTHAFAKEEGMWDCAVVMCLFENNWLRPHPALKVKAEGLAGRRYLRRSPAMAVGLTDHVWSWEEFLTFRCYHYYRE